MSHLRRVFVKHDDAGLADGELLALYLRERDDAAFEGIVRKHGPMVMGVCRRVLGNTHDAEDAFQATFLVLVRKASSLRSPSVLGNWLYGVAYRTALEARRLAARRRAKEAKVTPRTETDEDTWAGLREVLDQELHRLPDKYRQAIVLCDLEGKVRHEAARQLGCREGTVASRLSRGRQLLAKRLARHGFAGSAAMLAGLVAQHASAAIPSELLSATIKNSSLVAAGKTLAVSAEVAALVKGVLRTMLLLKLTTGTAVALSAFILLGLGAAGTWALAQPAAEKPARKAAVSVKTADDVATSAPTWREVLQMKHEHAVNVIACGAEWSAAGDDGGNLFAWRTKDGKDRKPLIKGGNDKLDSSVDRLQFMPDGKYLFGVIGGGRGLFRFDVGKGSGPGLGAPQPFYLGVSPDGAIWLEAHNEGHTLALRLNQWNQPQTAEFESVGYEAKISHAAMSTGDKWVAVTTSDGNLHIHERATLKKAHTIALPKGVVVKALQFSADGERLALARDDAVATIYDVAKGEEATVLKGHRGIVFAVAFSPDGKKVVTGGDDNTARLWDAHTGKALSILEGHADSVRCVAFDPSGEMLVTGSADKTVKVWKVR